MTVTETPQAPDSLMGISRHCHPLAQLTPQAPRGPGPVFAVMCRPVPVCGSSRYQLPSAWLCMSAKGSKRARGTFLRNPGPAQLLPKLAPFRTGLLSLASRLQPRHSAGPRAGSAE